MKRAGADILILRLIATQRWCTSAELVLAATVCSALVVTTRPADQPSERHDRHGYDGAKKDDCGDWPAHAHAHEQREDEHQGALGRQGIGDKATDWPAMPIS